MDGWLDGWLDRYGREAERERECQRCLLQEIASYDCRGWLNKPKICQAGNQEERSCASLNIQTRVAVVHRQNFLSFSEISFLLLNYSN